MIWPMSNVAQTIGERLHAAGIRQVFGHPGGEVVDLIEGFSQAGLEFVLARHETDAASWPTARFRRKNAPVLILRHPTSGNVGRR